MFILLIFLISWNDLSMKWNSSERYRELKTSALYAADSLLTTQGDPKSWEILNLTNSIDQIKSIGVVNKRGELNNAKLDSLVVYEDSNYEDIKQKLGLAKYEINIRVMGSNDNITYYVFGEENPQNNKETAIIERLAVLNDSIRVFKLTVWLE